MVSVDIKTEVRDGFAETDTERSLQSQVLHAMTNEAKTWMKFHGSSDVFEVRMKAWEKVHAALPEGAVKDWHGKTKWLSELDARVEQVSGNARNAVWGIARGAIAAEFPFASILPDNAPGVLDTWMAKMSGVAWESLIRNGTKAFESMGTAGSSAGARIDAIFSALTSGGPRILAPQGVQI